MVKRAHLSQRSTRVLAALGAILLPAADLLARGSCPVEAKLRLSTQAAQSAIGSLGLAKETATRVYFFDTDTLDLFKQRVILRVREGADNDFTVKVRQPDGDAQIHPSRLAGVPCEIDQTRDGAHVSYSVGSSHKVVRAPDTSDEVRKLLSTEQLNLLRRAGVSIDWGRIRRVVAIDSTKWTTSKGTTSLRSPYGRLTLELWKWPQGEILELSARAGAQSGAAAYSDLEGLAHTKGLPLSSSQDTKTETVLQTHHASP